MPETAQSTTPRRQQQRARETRGVLLQTAIDAFSTRGFESISVRQLEEIAGVKRGLVAYRKAFIARIILSQRFMAR